MSRALSINLPMWSVDLLRRRPRNFQFRANSQRENPREHPPILLVQAQRGSQMVARCCEQSARAGVQPGMSLAHARALLERDDCRIEAFDPQRDDASLRTLANWALRYSPVVAIDPPDGLFIDITGCQRVFGGEKRLLGKIAREIKALGFTVRLASAATFGCAWAAARFGGTGVWPVRIRLGSERHALAPLPIRALRIDELAAEAMEEVEITRIGHLFDLPRTQLAQRFGSDLLLRLDQALGSAFEVIDPVRPRHVPSAERAFDGPTTQLEAIEITIQDLLNQLCAQLMKLERGVRRLDLEMIRVDAQPIRTALTLSMPTRNVRHLWSLLRPRIQTINLGFGVERVALAAGRIGRLTQQQVERWQACSTQRAERAKVQGALGELVDTLAARMGPDRIKRLELMESHIPEMTFRHRSAMESPPRHALSAAVTTAGRPTILFQTPRPAGFDEHVVSCSGPERIAAAWWKQSQNSNGEEPASFPARDYFKIQINNGQWLWAFHDASTEHWFVHGLWV